MANVLVHYGILRRSGRYPWGSGGELLSKIDRMKAKGLTEKEIADGLGISTKELRDQKAIAKLEEKEAARLNVIRQKEAGMSITAISEEFDIPQSTVRDLLKPAAALKYKIIHGIANGLKSLVSKFGFVDVGEGSEIWMGVSRTKLDNAIAMLRNEGYTIHYLDQEQLGTQHKTRIMVLGGPNATFKEVLENRASIAVPNFHSNDGGLTFLQQDTLNSISADRVLVKYKDDGGAQKDGLIELRRGVPEFDLGDKNYAQVRMVVDDTHYMKGMAVFGKDLPDGIDVIYNTSKEFDSSKSIAENKLAAMKELEPESSISKVKAVVKPNTYLDKDGNEVQGVVNIVGEKTLNEEGAWATWDRNLASQVLSKQSPRIAKQQLDINYENAKAELEEINSLTDPTVRSHLLMQFADSADRASVDLKAAALPRQTTNVLLPDPTMKPNEIYAPNYDNGDVVSLIRYPHGGVFEIPTLTVNNKYSEMKDIIGTTAKDAVAVHPDVAARLSGADFDGDFVLAIPNRNKQLRTSPALEGLKDFDPQSYKIPEDLLYNEKSNPTGIKKMTDPQKQREMGNVSNLITDMTIQGAPDSEIVRAVRHSMVVIDAEKHALNWKQSSIDNGIPALKEKYQGGAKRGAATLISRTTSEYRVPMRKDHYTINEETGEKQWSYTNEVWIDKKGREHPRTMRSTKGAEFSPYDLVSDPKPGTAIERVYADYANNMTALANQARLSTVGLKPRSYSPQARATYRAEVASLDAKYKAAVRHRPIERKAQIIGGEIYKAKKDATPGMTYAQQQKEKGRSLVVARNRLNARKPTIEITPREWEAIEMGAVSSTRLSGILRNADMDQVRAHSTPRAMRSGLSTGKQARAQALIKSGYTTAEVARALGVSISQIQNMDKEL